MDYIYGELNEKVVAIKYEGLTTDSTTTQVDNIEGTIAVNVKDDYVKTKTQAELSKLNYQIGPNKNEFIDSITQTAGQISATTTQLHVSDEQYSEKYPLVTTYFLENYGLTKFIGESLTDPSTQPDYLIIKNRETPLYKEDYKDGYLVIYYRDKKEEEEEYKVREEWINKYYNWELYSTLNIHDEDISPLADITQSKIHGLRTTGHNYATTINQRGYLDEIDTLVADDSTNQSVEYRIRTKVESLDYPKVEFPANQKGLANNTIASIEEVDGKISVTSRTLNRHDFLDDDAFTETQIEQLPEDLAALNKRIDDLNYSQTFPEGLQNNIIASISQDKGQLSVTRRTINRNDFQPDDAFTEQQIENLPEDLAALNKRIDDLNYSETLPEGTNNNIIASISQDKGLIKITKRTINRNDFLEDDAFTEKQIENLPEDLIDIDNRISQLNSSWNYSTGKIINSISIDTSSKKGSSVTFTDRQLIEQDVQGLPQDISRIDTRISNLTQTWTESAGQIIRKIDIDTSKPNESAVTIESTQLVQADVQNLPTDLNNIRASVAKEVQDRKDAIDALDFEKITANAGEIISSVEQVNGKLIGEKRAQVRGDFANNFFAIAQVENLQEELDDRGGSITKEKEERIAADNVLQANINTETAARIAEDAKKVNIEVTSAQGKALIFNESDGGGAKFENVDGTDSFVGVNNGGANGIAAQLYAVTRSSNSSQGSKLDVTKNGIYYTTGTESGKSASERDISDNELAVKKNVTQVESELNQRIGNEETRAAQAEATITQSLNTKVANLNSAISQEISTRSENDDAIIEALKDESKERKAAITAEATSRDNADIEVLRKASAQVEKEKTAREEAVSEEAKLRYVEDANLQEQIDTIEAKTDVVDVVSCYDRGTDTSKSDIVHYDTSKLHDNDIVKVLQDETKNNSITYYRWNLSKWSYIGALGPFYTKAETDIQIGIAAQAVQSSIDTHTARVDNPHSVTKAQVGLGNVDNTSDINKPISTAQQAALDLKANISSIGNGKLSISQNGKLAGTFTANQSGDVSIDLDVTAGQAQADWNQTDTTRADYIKNKPTVGSGVITISQNGTQIGQFNVNQTTDQSINIQATVQQQADWNQTDTTAVDYIKNKPSQVVTKDWFIIEN